MNMLPADTDKPGSRPEREDLIIYKLMFETAYDMLFIYSEGWAHHRR